MGVFTFLIALIKEAFSIFVLQSEVDVKTKDRYKLFLRKIFLTAMIVALVLVTNRAMKLSTEYAELREKHEQATQSCELKNQQAESSDRGNGLSVKAPVTKISHGADLYTIYSQ